MSTKVYHQFIFEKYEFDRRNLTAKFYYSLDKKINFCETLVFPRLKKIENRPKLIGAVLFNLHLALGISYYKTYCPKKIIINSGRLNPGQAIFWNKLYTKGLGEFFYTNKIDFRGLINFPWKNIEAKPARADLKSRALVPLGGGKDSCLAVEKLKELGFEMSLITLGDSRIQKETAAVSGQKRLVVERRIDRKLFELNGQGAYNGHVPISAVYSWVTILAAILYDYKYAVFSNEKSASFGNVDYLGENINHQYSKSFEFEKDLADYLRKFVTPDLEYFSLLRKYSELKIVESFVKYKKYLPVFSSCNRNFKIIRPGERRWCGECPKCAFAFSQLAAFLPRQELIRIFEKNLFADPKLWPLYRELLGEKNIKPFDCVGEAREVQAALLLASRQPGYKNDIIIKNFLRTSGKKIKDPAGLIAGALRLDPENNIPENFKKILILGAGQEGRSVLEYLQKKYDRPDISLADREKSAAPVKGRKIKIITGPDYLKNLESYDLIIKSPGISPYLPEIKAALDRGQEIASATNIFFAHCRGTIIGVTATKGKSTTATLIYKILKTAGLPVYLVGNIGADPLKYLDKNEGREKIFVYELSSYQLELLRQSPRISVFLNIFPDHLPYHRGLGNYRLAKANIARYQTARDYLIYNSGYPFIKKLAGQSRARTIDYLHNGVKMKNNLIYYKNEKLFPATEIKLLGRHNLHNIFAAITAAELFPVKAVDIKKAVTSFKNLEHRLEFVGGYKNIKFYDDAISTTPESTLAAIEVFKRNLGCIILGGEDRGYDFSGLAERLAALKINNIVLFPDSGAKIWREILKAYKKRGAKIPKKINTRSMDAAVKFAYENTPAGKTCLLSTASPSYSIFKNFEEKGDLFQQAVKKFAN